MRSKPDLQVLQTALLGLQSKQLAMVLQATQLKSAAR